MAVNSLDVRVRLLEARLAQDEARKTSRAISGIGSSSKKADEETKGFGGTMIAGLKGMVGLIGAAGIYEFFKSGVTGALSLNKSMTAVNNSLGEIGIHSKAVTAQLKAQAEAASTAGGGSTEQQLSGMSQFIQQTHNLTEAQKAQAAADKLAVGSGMDYAQAQQLVAGGLAGRTRGLQRYLGIIKPVTTAQNALSASYQAAETREANQTAFMGKAGEVQLKQWELIHRVTDAQKQQASVQDKAATAQMVLDAVNKRYAHTQESLTQRLEDTKHALQNLTVNLASALLPAINTVAKALDGFTKWLSKNQGVAVALGGVVATLATVIIAGKLVHALKSAGDTLKITTLASKLFGTSAQDAGEEAATGAETATVGWEIFASATLIGLVIPAIVLIMTHFQQVKQIAADVVDWIKGHWQLLVSILIGPIGAAVLFIITHFNLVKHAVSDVLHFIEGIGNDVLHALTWPFQKAFDFIKSGFNSVKNFIHSIPVIGGLLNAGGPVHRAGGGMIYRDLGGSAGTDTVPAMLSPGEYVLNSQVTSELGMGNIERALSNGVHGGEQEINLRIHAEPMKLTDQAGRILANLVLKYTLERAARGTSSLVGGSLATAGGFTTYGTGAAV